MARAVRAEALVGRVIADKYRIDALLGTGGMGAVYRALQTSLGRAVAVKVVRADHLNDRSFASRFRREAKAASMFEHKNSLRVLDFGQEPDGLFYLVMEYIDGRDLGHVIHDDFPLAPDRIVDLLSQVLAALAVAHDQGILHRDLKPENVMISEGSDDEGRRAEVVKVCDFGLAKMLEKDKKEEDGVDPQDLTATGTLTAQGMLVGTPEYMSPEQFTGARCDARSDLYGVGAVLYHMLAGRPPFEAPSPFELAMKHVEEAPRAPSQLVPGVDPHLETVCLRALAKRPEDRYASARDMRADLRATADGVQASGPTAAAAVTAPSLPGLHADRPGPSFSDDPGRIESPLPVSASGVAPPSQVAPRRLPKSLRPPSPAPLAAPASDPASPAGPSRAALVFAAFALVLVGALLGALVARR